MNTCCDCGQEIFSGELCSTCLIDRYTATTSGKKIMACGPGGLYADHDDEIRGDRVVCRECHFSRSLTAAEIKERRNAAYVATFAGKSWECFKCGIEFPLHKSTCKCGRSVYLMEYERRGDIKALRTAYMWRES